ncbi:MAG: hypothetical protein R3336_10520, partial [Phycisphaeraceae bacterium]|nr:hypothetical protein [Phycisphaeraceae bacterium]
TGGNAAYPLQLLWSSGPSGRAVGRFIVIDLVTSIGTAMPIWGGRDTLTEHFFNRLAIRLVQFVTRLRGG